MNIKHLIGLAAVIHFCTISLAQVPENIRIGIYGRQENNFYKYYNGNKAANLQSTRNSLGYSAGIAVHSSINYLLNADLGFGFSEMTYSPNIRNDENNTSLYDINMRLYHVNATVELKLGSREKIKPAFFIGFQGNFIRDFSVAFSGVGGAFIGYPSSRIKFQTGFSTNFHLKKDRILFKPYFGIRLPFGKAVSYETKINQFFLGATLAFKVKSW